jgi:isopentenyl-diphosphate Delta-isomerase
MSHDSIRPNLIPDKIKLRKMDKLNTVLQRNVLPLSAKTGFKKIHFEHNCLPELNFDTVDIGTQFLCKYLTAPFLISSMTGGQR